MKEHKQMDNPENFASDLMQSPVGPIYLQAGERGLVRVHFLGTDAEADLPRPTGTSVARAIVRQTKAQLAEYFAGARKTFELPLAASGTAFQLRVWGALQRIPFGTTQSYAELARSIGQASAARAVGAANGRNPLPIIVPCHRVIGQNGSLTGFSAGLAIKSALLKLEGFNSCY
jgi:methylated-DNA-[protein]-cysteine S-methyltransferase